MNMCVPVHVWMSFFISLETIPTSRIAGSYNNSWCNHQTLFHSCCKDGDFCVLSYLPVAKEEVKWASVAQGGYEAATTLIQWQDDCESSGGGSSPVCNSAGTTAGFTDKLGVG